MANDNGNRPRFEMSFSLGGVVQLVVIIVGGMYALHTVSIDFAERMTRVETTLAELKTSTAQELSSIWRTLAQKADRPTGNVR